MSKLTSFIVFSDFKWIVVIFFIIFNQKQIIAFDRLYTVRNKPLQNEEQFVINNRNF